MRLLVVALLGFFVLAACNDSPPSTPNAAAPLARDEHVCPLTLANGETPPRDTAGLNHGNGRLRTYLWPHNVVVAEDAYVEPNGAITMKWPWWRGVRGTLHVTGSRLDGPSAPLRADIPDGYGSSGFQPSGLDFPRAGCWRVTARVGNAELTFVTLVVKASTYSLVSSYWRRKHARSSARSSASAYAERGAERFRPSSA